MARRKTLLGSAAIAMAVAVLTASSNRTAAQDAGKVVWGTWVVALDTSVFGFPGGRFPGVITFHQDGTFIITDGGDLGSAPFTHTDTAQQGVWIHAGQAIKMTALFLQKNEVTGEIEGWHRTRHTYQFVADSDHMSGFAEDDFLPCDPAGPTVLKLLNCPDPITGAFIPGPVLIPIELTRLRVVP